MGCNTKHSVAVPLPTILEMVGFSPGSKSKDAQDPSDNSSYSCSDLPSADQSERPCPSPTSSNKKHKATPSKRTTPDPDFSPPCHQQPAHIAKQETGWDYYCRTRPVGSNDLKNYSNSKSPLMTACAVLPVQRPVVTNSFSKNRYNERRGSWCAGVWMLQAVGVRVPIPCIRCARGRGLWNECVVAPPEFVKTQTAKTARACACCMLDGNAARNCSFLPTSAPNSHSLRLTTGVSKPRAAVKSASRAAATPILDPAAVTPAFRPSRPITPVQTGWNYYCHSRPAGSKNPPPPGTNHRRTAMMNAWADLPVQREVIVNPSSKVKYRERKDSRSCSNTSVWILQAVGIPAPVPCRRCALGRGPWKECVVSPPEFMPNTVAARACACCMLDGRAKMNCSFLPGFKPGRRPLSSLPAATMILAPGAAATPVLDLVGATPASDFFTPEPEPEAMAPTPTILEDVAAPSTVTTIPTLPPIPVSSILPPPAPAPKSTFEALVCDFKTMDATARAHARTKREKHLAALAKESATLSGELAALSAAELELLGEKKDNVVIRPESTQSQTRRDHRGDGYDEESRHDEDHQNNRGDSGLHRSQGHQAH